MDYRFRGRIFEGLIYIGCEGGVWLINGVLRYIQLIYIYIYIYAIDIYYIHIYIYIYILYV